MKPSQYAIEIVIPTIVEFGQKRWDRRRAYLACLVTYHLADFVSVQLRLANAETVRKAVGLSDEFLAVEAVNIAAKHVTATRSERARKIGLRAGQERIWYPAFAGLARAGATMSGDKVGGVKIMIQTRQVDAFASICAVLKSFQITYPELFEGVDWHGLLT